MSRAGTAVSVWSASTEASASPTIIAPSEIGDRTVTATSYVHDPSEQDAKELIENLKVAFALTRVGHESASSSRTAEMALTAFDTALDVPGTDHPFASLAPIELTPYLATLLTLAGHTQDDAQTRLRNHARASLTALVAKASSAREIHHAMLLRMARAGKRSAERDDDEADEELDRTAAFFELSVLIELQAEALRRIRTKRLVSFVRGISNASKSALIRIGAAQISDDQRVNEISEATLVRSLAELIASIIEIEGLDSEVLEVLRDFLLDALARLASSPPLAAVLAECAVMSPIFNRHDMTTNDRNYFRKNYPRFTHRLVDAEPGTRLADAEAWRTVKVAARGLKLGSQGLFYLAGRHAATDPGPPRFSDAPVNGSGQLAIKPPPPAPPPLATQGAFVLLAHLVADDSEPAGIIGGWYAIRAMLPHVLVSLGPMGTATDEALFWVYWALDNGSGKDGEPEEVDEATLYPLVEGVSSLAATASSDDQRFLAFRLLTIIIIKALGDRDDLQLVLLLDLIQDAPYPMLRASAVGLLSTLMVERLPALGKSLFASPVFIQELGPHVMRCEPADLSQVTLEKFLDDCLLQANSERLGLVYTVLTVDEHNRTTLKSKDRLRVLRSCLISPLTTAMARWRADGDVTDEAKNALGVLECQLELAEGAIAGLEGGEAS